MGTEIAEDSVGHLGLLQQRETSPSEKAPADSEPAAGTDEPKVSDLSDPQEQ